MYSNKSNLSSHGRLLIAVCVFLCVLLIVPAVSSLYTSSIAISNYGSISSTYTVTAQSGSPVDIQAAINQVHAAGGGTVCIPAGTYSANFTANPVIIPAGVNIVGASVAGCSGHSNNWTNYTGTTTLINTDVPTTSHVYGNMFTVDGYQSKQYATVWISNINFVATGPTNAANENSNCGSGIFMRQNFNFRIFYCSFTNFCNVAVMVSAGDGDNASATCYGAIDHCVFNDPYKSNGGGDYVWGYGIICTGNVVYYSDGTVNPGHAAWNNNLNLFGYYGPASGVGMAYIEDCHFSDSRHAISEAQGGWYCSRYNLFDSPICEYTVGSMDVHGAAFPSGYGEESYGNTIVGAHKNKTPWGDTYNSLAVQLRGGKSLIYNNTFTDDTNNPNSYFAQLTNGDYLIAGAFPLMNIGRTYIWNNVYTNSSFLTVSTGITQNTDYFLRAPTQVQDGFTYVPYLYPLH
jgi:hypothetical protein